MSRPADPLHRAKFLAVTVLVGTVALLVLLVAIPLIVPHQSLPEPIIVFVSIFILIAALIAGIALAYLFLLRAPGTQAPAGAEPVPPATTGGGNAGGSPNPAFQDLAIRLLDGDERRLLRVIVESKGDILQQDLVRITAFSEAKVSRLLDRLEERGLVRRERQGMANRVRLTLESA
jgi:DNA-binding transcriptional ArsR family regulator